MTEIYRWGYLCSEQVHDSYDEKEPNVASIIATCDPVIQEDWGS